MKLDSKYFDRIRVKPEEDRLLRDQVPTCEWDGCSKPAKHRAPKGRDAEGAYHNFCLDHVRQYNKQYNYFSGMDDPELQDWRKKAETGHRPTWKLGQNSWAANKARQHRNGKSMHEENIGDPFGFLHDRSGNRRARAPSRQPRNKEVQALHTLGLDETADAKKVKLQYKTLVKRLHPDANNGSRDNEEKLREIIQAYDYLKKSGYR
jgi:hypothetical protein